MNYHQSLEQALKYAKQKTFNRPENYEKIKDLPDGKELWAGANDWECGWTWAAVHKTDVDKDSEPEQWLSIDHSSCPGCRGTCDCCDKKESRKCQDHAKDTVKKWIKILTQNN